ncbi:hypothetical protein ABEB36_002879 [Hypothenemus hampei]|uniref:DH domain-containing protein n=1 Tax=Hypothenemus hampei TaxID=57062 RepID=A0ABD1F7A5_HYPHA
MNDEKKCKTTKYNKMQKIVNLFEISRPHKQKLERTNSLPTSIKTKNSQQLSDGDNTLIFARSSLRSNKGKYNKKYRNHEERAATYRTNYKNDEEKISERCKVKNHVEDVSAEIQNSDTELEITHRDDQNAVQDLQDRLSMLTLFTGIETSISRNISEPHSDYNEDIEWSKFSKTEDLPNSESNVTSLALNIFKKISISRQEIIEDQLESVDAYASQFENTYNQSQISHSEDKDVISDTQNIDVCDNENEWKYKSFVQLAHSNNLDAESAQTQNATTHGRYLKNSRVNSRRNGVIKGPISVQELTKRFENFKDAAEKNETETFRKSVISEFDEEIEKMRLDGFEEDVYLSLVNNNQEFDETEEESVLDTIPDEEDANNTVFETIISLNGYSDIQENIEDDLFGEKNLSENLETGLSYLETYNAEGKELIICSLQVDRKSVDLQSFDQMKDNADNILANNEKLLILFSGDELVFPSESKAESDSKRNTMYSTTSGESFDEEDLDNAQSCYNVARRETFTDEKGIVRIERIAPCNENLEEQSEYINTINNYYEVGEEDEQKEQEQEQEDHEYETIHLEHEILFSSPQIKKDKIQYILEEIKSTERKYVADLKKVLKVYKPFLDERCPTKVDIVFGNMEHIYDKQKQFLEALELLEETDVRSFVRTFLDFESLFRLYPRYFKNSPKANIVVKEMSFLVKEKQDRIQDKLNLSAYLLTPLQRLAKYKLFFENIIKHLEKDGNSTDFVQLALDLIKKYMSKGNDAVAVASILHSPLHPKDYGSLISREKFSMIKPKKSELMVFLFENVIVFASERLGNMEQFDYYQSIKTHDLRIATFENNNTIHLTDFTKTKRRNSTKYTYVLDAKNVKLKNTWKQQIEEILWKQMEKIKEKTLKQYQNGAKSLRKPVRSREERSKSTGSAIFYVDE